MLKSVTQWLDATAARLPDKVAFGEDSAEGGTLSFAELRGASRAIGTLLAKRGHFKQPVLVAMPKTPQCVASMLGAAYANCPYVPLDIEMPPERVKKIIDKLQPAAYISDEKRLQYLLDGGAAKADILIYGDASETAPDDAVLAEVHSRRISVDLLYIIFTSGSTGEPKGVAVNNNSNVIGYSIQLSEKFGLDESTVFGQSIPFFFDASILYIYQTLRNGCTDWILSKTDLMFAARTVDFLNAHKCNTIYWVPTGYNIVAKSGIFKHRRPEFLTKCLFVGEVMPNSVLNVWRRALPRAVFINLFGSTEITGTFLYYEVDRDFSDNEPLPIGIPYDNIDVLLLDEDSMATAHGVIGELCVRGENVSGGYWNEPEKTAAVFIQNPLNPHYRETIYRTGDLAYRNERGEFMYAGRRDFQIKHAGHRIELGEIEIQAGTMDGVELCACVYDTEAKQILLFYVGTIAPKEIKNALRRKLPEYMVPGIRKLDSIPRTGSGKINRTELRKRKGNTAEER
jgi:amino acid adenylation domain-containing protein